MPEGVNWRDEPVQGEPVQGEPVQDEPVEGEPAAAVYRRLQAATKMAEWFAQGSSQAR